MKDPTGDSSSDRAVDHPYTREAVPAMITPTSTTPPTDSERAAGHDADLLFPGEQPTGVRDRTPDPVERDGATVTTTEAAPTVPPAPGPCPAFCDQPAGHEWNTDCAITSRRLGRQHERSVGQDVGIVSGEIAGEVDPVGTQVYVNSEVENRAEGDGLVLDLQTAINLAFPRKEIPLPTGAAAGPNQEPAEAVLANGASPCPVAYCDEAGHHAWSEPTTEPRRTHRQDNHIELAVGRIEVGAEVYETPEGVSEPVVEIGFTGGEFELRTAAEYKAFEKALYRSARTAFGDALLYVSSVVPPGSEGPALEEFPEPQDIPECPSWCQKPEGHPWDDRSVGEYGDYGRMHTREVGEFVRISQTDTYPTNEGSCPASVVVDALCCDSLEDTDALTASIAAAASLAFPPTLRWVGSSDALSDALRDHADVRKELQSAEAEVRLRAGTPGDQLTAAWLRLGKAHAAAAERWVSTCALLGIAS